MLPFTQKSLASWADPHTFKKGVSLCDEGRVSQVDRKDGLVSGVVTIGDRDINSAFQLERDGSVDNQCPCHDSRERGVVCIHAIAMAMELIRRSTDPERMRKAEEELRRAKRLEEIDENAYITRVAPDEKGAVPAELRVYIEPDWAQAYEQGHVPITCTALYGDDEVLLNEVPRDLPLSFSEQDDSILFVLEDISEGPAQGSLRITTADFMNLLSLCGGKNLHVSGSSDTIVVNAVKMESVLRVDLDHENGEMILMVHTELPFMDAKSFPIYLVQDRTGWVFDAGQFWPLANLLPPPLHSIYKEPVVVARDSIPRFLETEVPLLEEHMRVEKEITADLFTIEPGEPHFRLQVRGSPASIAATLYAEYDDITLVAGKAEAAGQFAKPDPTDFLHYTTRNMDREVQALERLGDYGLGGAQGDKLDDIVGTREVLNFLGSGVPRVRRMGWRVELEGRVEPLMESVDFVTPVVHVKDDTGGGWFDIGFDYEDTGGQSVSAADIQRALMKGDSYIERGGRTVLIDADAITTARDVFSDCASGEGSQSGSFRMDGIHAAYVKSALDGLDGIDIEASSSWLSTANRQNRSDTVEPVPLSDTLEKTLRSYQKDGVYWLRFLESNLFCGILADEMGLGKTLQTLVWASLSRSHPEAADRPSLIVCPTSLVQNWAEEAEKFVPDLRVEIMQGTGRHEKWDAAQSADLVVTSYALMRRDIEQHEAIDYAAAILDEAQHIKNRSTQNAVAAKRLKAHHRLVLTGTPVENSVSDLWSIMDFLMPGYLGPHPLFKENYELPISRGGPDGDQAQSKLRKKLHPFLLRRMKKDVAKDLPDKIQKIAHCTLSKDQQVVYKQVLESSRRTISNMVMKSGFDKSRMEIFKTLLRLRQTCCHLDLLKLKDLKAKAPSAKMDLFFELLDEAMDGGHRVLVFSQFTTMLGILREEMEERGIAFCYLDGKTKDRQGVVRQFNTEREIPAFLMSLKAGGTGLNLTGADMVIHFDPWWNPAVEDQATDRAHRIGQKKTVYALKLITTDTVEEKVLELQQRKKSIIDATLATDEQVMQKLSWDDVQELLEL